MPTELPSRRRPIAPESTKEGRLFFAVAVLAMLVVSAFVMTHPTAFASSFGN